MKSVRKKTGSSLLELLVSRLGSKLRWRSEYLSCLTWAMNLMKIKIESKSL